MNINNYNQIQCELFQAAHIDKILLKNIIFFNKICCSISTIRNFSDDEIEEAKKEAQQLIELQLKNECLI